VKCNAINLCEDVLQPQLKSAEEETFSLNTRNAILGQVETHQVDGATSYEEIVSFVEVDITATVETTQCDVIQPYVTNLYAFSRWNIRGAI